MVEKVARNGGGIEEFSMPWEGVKERKLWNKKIFFYSWDSTDIYVGSRKKTRLRKNAKKWSALFGCRNFASSNDSDERWTGLHGSRGLTRIIFINKKTLIIRFCVDRRTEGQKFHLTTEELSIDFTVPLPRLRGNCTEWRTVASCLICLFYSCQREDTDYTVFYSTDIYHSYGGITSITTTNLTIGLLYHFLKKIVSPKNSDFSSLPLHCRQGRTFCQEAGWNRCERWTLKDERFTM